MMKVLIKCLAVLSALLLVVGLSACGKGGEASGSDNAAAGKTEAATEEKTEAAGPEIQWLSYRLIQSELRNTQEDEEEQYGLPEKPEGEQFVIVKLLGANGKTILLDDIKEENWSALLLKTSDGETYEPGKAVWWGSGYSDEKGFYSDEQQEGFYLFYLVPEGTAVTDLSVFVKDAA